jgi:nicotinamide-nucleotide amidase
MPSAEIFSQGDEVVTGQIADTNSAWLAERLVELGFDVVRHTTVGDRLDDLVAAYREIAARTDLCVSTGGLGPTDDDLTAPAIAKAFDRPQELDPVALAQIEERFRSFGRTMAPVNRRQAMLPRGAERIDNTWGTAPGFSLPGSPPGKPSGHGRAWIVCLPGVPREMKAMFDAHVAPRLVERFELAPGRLITFKATGIGESDLQQALEGLPLAGHRSADGLAPPEGIVVGFRTKLPENHLKLRVRADVPDAVVREHVRAVLGAIGRWVFTVEGIDPAWAPDHDCGGGDLAAVVGRALQARRQTLAVAESCTGGRLAAACTAWPGSSAWFREGVVTYSNEAKVRLLGVLQADLDAHGAVSEPIARAMAEGVRNRSSATWGIGITGIAGPEGGTPDKPVGTVHVAVSGPTGTSHRALRLPGDRERVQILSVSSALILLHRAIHPQSPQE